MAGILMGTPAEEDDGTENRWINTDQPTTTKPTSKDLLVASQ